MNAPVRTPSRRAPAVAGLAAATVAAAVAVTLAARGGSPPPAVFTPSTRTVTYEVAGPGPVAEIAYVVGAGNRTARVTDPKLPWREQVTLDVGYAGGSGRSPTLTRRESRRSLIFDSVAWSSRKVSKISESRASTSTGDATRAR